MFIIKFVCFMLKTQINYFQESLIPKFFPETIITDVSLN